MYFEFAENKRFERYKSISGCIVLHSNELRTKKGELSMCTIIDSYIEQGFKQGFKQSLDESPEGSRAAILKTAIKGGLTDEQLINILEYTPLEVKIARDWMRSHRKKTRFCTRRISKAVMRNVLSH